MNKKLNLPLKLTGLTLIELAVTLAIVAVMAGVSIQQMKSLKSSKRIVDNVTSIIVNHLNQAQAKSNFSSGSNSFKVCHLSPGAGVNSRAACDDGVASWRNVNGTTLDPKAIVTITAYDSTGVALTNQKTVTYLQGAINHPTLQLGNSTNASFIITVTGSTQDPSCGTTIPSNTISVWQNGVIDVEKNC